MLPEEAKNFLNSYINDLVSAKLSEVSEYISGLEMVILHIFNSLERQKVMTKEEALRSLKVTREGLPKDWSPRIRNVFLHIEKGLEDMMKHDAKLQETRPEALRSQFRVIPGDRADDSDTNQD